METSLTQLRDNWLKANDAAKAAKTGVTYIETTINHATMLVGQAIAATVSVSTVDRALAKKAELLVTSASDLLNEAAAKAIEKSFEAGKLAGIADALWDTYKAAEEEEKQRKAAEQESEKDDESEEEEDKFQW